MAIYRLNKRDDFGYPIPYDSASSAGLLISKMPQKGLVFYSALTSAEGFEVTGNPQFVTKDGIPCVYFDGESYFKTEVDDMPQGSSPRSIAVYFYIEDFNGDTGIVATCGGGAENTLYDVCLSPQRKIYIQGWSNDTYYSFKPDVGRFYHLTITLESDGTEKLYVNGELIETKDHSGLGSSGNDIWVGSNYGDYLFTGYIAALRIYNRALSLDEITLLAGEFSA